MKIALAGNPNSGKSTLFNLITRMNQTIGNWTGVTIEKKEGRYFKDKNILITDLPGIYSMTSYTLEEKITGKHIMTERPDVIINIIDSTNLERNLYLTTQLIECGINMVIALNFEDELLRNGIAIDSYQLEKILGIKVISISALKNKNIDKLMDAAIAECGKQSEYKPMQYDYQIENALSDIRALMTERKMLRIEAVKLLERDNYYIKELSAEKKAKLNIIIDRLENIKGEKTLELISNERYKFIESVSRRVQLRTDSKSQKITDRIDSVVTNKYLAFPIFFIIIFLMYSVSVTWLGAKTVGLMKELVIVKAGGAAKNFMTSISMPEWLVALTADGIIKGVGTVLTFLPQIMILFLFISVLEGCGYMARVAYIMDRLFRKIGLSGKSFIPMIIGCGCSVPAIMSSRTIENNDERRLTIMLTPFVPCSAKLPVFALFAGVFFPDNPFAAPSMYLLGILMVILSGLFLKKLKFFKTESDTFILELPRYRVPKLNNILLQLWDKAKTFFIKAGTIIFAASVALWFLQSFDIRFQISDTENSILAGIGRLTAPVFAPLGFNNWKAAVSLFTGFFAKEGIVSTLGILLSSDGSAEGLKSGLYSIFTPLSAYAFMVFTLLAAPCVAAIGASKRELGSLKWMLIAIGFQTAAAYCAAMLIYFLGTLYNLYHDVFVVIIIILLSVSLIMLSFYFLKRNRYANCGAGCKECIIRNNCVKN